MFRFSKEQKIFDIAGVKIGGQPGELPTAMIGSIFYHKHKILYNEKTGEFDKQKAEELLMKEKEISDETGNPRIVDVCCGWPQAFEKFIDFIADVIEGPFSIDGVTADARIAGAKYVGEAGLSERVIYNSITPETRENEISAIKEAKIKSAIFLTLNAKRPTLSGRLQVLDDLLIIAQKAEIENILVDTCVLDIPDPGPVSKAIYYVKEEYGLPAGAGIHNAIDMWRKRRKKDPTKYMLASAVANVTSIILGANFLLYGPIENAGIAYPTCALADAYIAYAARQEYGTKPLTTNHPLFRIFR
ncbi:MAG: tetrahydromethanopterin S-methyltransferase subunit H [Candidatus Bathyarchaeia archaeon]